MKEYELSKNKTKRKQGEKMKVEKSRRGNVKYTGCDDNCFHCQYPDCIIPVNALNRMIRGESKSQKRRYARKETENKKAKENGNGS